jgi:AraC-like DNA-binding protein
VVAHVRVCRRQFRQAFGESPHQYLMSRRMERAAALLRDTDEPVGAICKGVGLRSVGSFTTSFGRAFGVSPAAYRVSRRRAAVAAIPLYVLRRWARPRGELTGRGPPAARSPASRE